MDHQHKIPTSLPSNPDDLGSWHTITLMIEEAAKAGEHLRISLLVGRFTGGDCYRATIYTAFHSSSSIIRVQVLRYRYSVFASSKDTSIMPVTSPRCAAL